MTSPPLIRKSLKNSPPRRSPGLRRSPVSPERDKFIANGVIKAGTKSAPKATSTLDRPKIFVSWDKDKDGFLSKEEFIPHIADKADAPARFVRFDQDKDGRLSKDEFVRAGN